MIFPLSDWWHLRAPSATSCTSAGLFMGHDVRVPLSCSLINNDHDMSAQWAVKSSISTDQTARGLLPLDWDCEENVLVIKQHSPKHEKKINTDAFGNHLIHLNHLIPFSFSSEHCLRKLKLGENRTNNDCFWTSLLGLKYAQHVLFFFPLPESWTRIYFISKL